jgi:hypothetical protein
VRKAVRSRCRHRCSAAREKNSPLAGNLPRKHARHFGKLRFGACIS